MSVLPACYVCAPSVVSAETKKESDLLELELQAVMSNHVVAGD